MENILDDEFVIQMDDSPPFSWIRQTPNRFMSCNVGNKIGTIQVNAEGNALIFAAMARDRIGDGVFKIGNSFSLSGEGTNCIITYSGQLKKALIAMETSENKGIVISSGGVIKNLARSKGWDYIPLPKGYPSRFLFPEVFGCLLSLSGMRIDASSLENFIDSISPSEITSYNEAKGLAALLADKQFTVIYDENSIGLAMRFQRIFNQNAGVTVEVREVSQLKYEGSDINEDSAALFLTPSDLSIKSISVGNFPYDSTTTTGYLKNALIGEFSSLYLGLLRSKEIELLDIGIE